MPKHPRDMAPMGLQAMTMPEEAIHKLTPETAQKHLDEGRLLEEGAEFPLMTEALQTNKAFDDADIPSAEETKPWNDPLFIKFLMGQYRRWQLTKEHAPSFLAAKSAHDEAKDAHREAIQTAYDVALTEKARQKFLEEMDRADEMPGLGNSDPSMAPPRKPMTPERLLDDYYKLRRYEEAAERSMYRHPRHSKIR